MTKRKIAALAVSVILIIAWVTHRAFLWDVFLEDTSDQACEKPLFGHSLVYCLPNSAADRARCAQHECGPTLWCDCAWAPRPEAWYSEEP